MTDPNKLREERAGKIAKARDIRDKAATEKRSLTTEERSQIDALIKAAQDLLAQAQQLETLASEEQSLQDPATQANSAEGGAEGAAAAGGTRSQKRGQPVTLGGDGATPTTREYRNAQRRSTPEYRAQFRRWCVDGVTAFEPEERRALSANDDANGGYMVAPEQFMTELIAAVEDECILRGLVRVISLKGAGSISAPAKTSRMSDAEWTAEVAAAPKDSALKFGKRTLTPHPLAKEAIVSETLLRLSALPADSIVMQAIAEVVGITIENGILNGDGVGKPLGLFFPSNDGVPTSRDVRGANTATELMPDTLIRAKYSLKGQYQKSSSTRWLFHREIVGDIQLMKDANDQYLWQPGLVAGAPDRILNIPVEQSEFAPNVKTANAYVGLIGDFKQYWFVELLAMRIQRLMELYAETNQIGFIARLEADGAPVKAEAFSRIQLAAS